MNAQHYKVLTRAQVMFRDYGWKLTELSDGMVQVSEPCNNRYGFHCVQQFSCITSALDWFIPIIADDDFTARAVNIGH